MVFDAYIRKLAGNKEQHLSVKCTNACIRVIIWWWWRIKKGTGATGLIVAARKAAATSTPGFVRTQYGNTRVLCGGGTKHREMWRGGPREIRQSTLGSRDFCYCFYSTGFNKQRNHFCLLSRIRMLHLFSLSDSGYVVVILNDIICYSRINERKEREKEKNLILINLKENKIVLSRKLNFHSNLLYIFLNLVSSSPARLKSLADTEFIVLFFSTKIEKTKHEGKKNFSLVLKKVDNPYKFLQGSGKSS
ncbi:hypothetical protein B566_EDAN008896, partial [Ephemera danica]